MGFVLAGTSGASEPPGWGPRILILAEAANGDAQQESKKGKDKDKDKDNGDKKDRRKDDREDDDEHDREKRTDDEGHTANENGSTGNGACKKLAADAEELEQFKVVVKNSLDKPVQGATVYLEWEEDTSKKKKTKKDGTATFPNIPISVPYVKIIAATYATYTACVNLADTDGSLTVKLTKY